MLITKIIDSSVFDSVDNKQNKVLLKKKKRINLFILLMTFHVRYLLPSSGWLFLLLILSVLVGFIMSLDSIPKDLRSARACLVCSLIKVN